MANLKTVEGVELMKVGNWNASTGKFNVTPELIAAAIDAHNSRVLRKPVVHVKLGHTDPRFDGNPALGYVDNLRTSPDGSTLIADLHDVPEWLADNDMAAYPDRSIEGYHNYVGSDGDKHPFVLTGLALLGEKQPAITDLMSMQEFYETGRVAAAGEIGGELVMFTSSGDEPVTEASQGDSDVSAAIGSEGKDAAMADYAEIAKKLGIAEDADQATVLAALDEALAERADNDDAEGEGAPNEGEGHVSASADGVVQLDQATYDSLVHAAAQVGDLVEARAADEREVVVMAAINDGRIPPARKQFWLDALKADPEGMAEQLSKLQKGLIPVKAEIGHSVGHEFVTDESSDDALYASLFGKGE